MSDNEYDDGVEHEEDGLEFPWAEIPTSMKGLRACKRCSLVKGNDQVMGRVVDLQHATTAVLDNTYIFPASMMRMIHI